MIRFSGQVASVAIALCSATVLAAEVPDVPPAAPLYAVTPPRDFADVKLATYVEVGNVAANPKNGNVFSATYGNSPFYSLESSCWVRTSTNAGQTWGGPKKLPMPEGDPYCVKSALAWAPDGSRLYAAYSYLNRNAYTGGAGVAISSSTDRGVTWTPPTVVVDFKDFNALGAHVKLATPLNAADSSWLYILIAKQSDGNDLDTTFFGRSADGGKTWSLLQNAPYGAVAGGPGGEVLISYSKETCAPPTCPTVTGKILVNHSSDRGLHFQEDIVAVPNAIGDTAVAFGGAGTAHIIYTQMYENAPAFGPYYVYSTKTPYTKWSQPTALNEKSPALYVAAPALTVSSCGSSTSVLHAVWLDSIGSGKDHVYYARKVAKTGEEWSPKLRLSGSSINYWWTYGSTTSIAAGLGTAVAVWGKYYEPARVYASRIAPGVTCP